MRLKEFTCISLTAAILLASTLHAQQREQEREIIYTFAGPVASAGYNMVTYRDWFGTYSGTKKPAGLSYAGGCCLALYAQYFMGDFSIQYIYNALSGLPVYHLQFSTSARANIRIGSLLHFTPGLGLYMESSPSDRAYRGSGGGLAVIGFALNTSFDTKIFIDLVGRYGYFGLGEGSTKFSFGINIGFIFKVGRI